METIIWRPEVNALTTPQSYRPRHIPRAILGYDELAALIEQKNPVCNAGLVKTILLEMRETVREQLTNGNQISLEGFFTCHISLSGRLAAPNDPVGPPETSVHTKLYASKRLEADVQKNAHLEREAQDKKLPLISTAEDTLLKLPDVLNPDGVLRLTGEDLYFDAEAGTGGCVIEGTESGRAAQSRLNLVSNSAVMLMPEIPAQAHPWNNEYTVSVTTRYTPHGTPRTGTYERMLRAPLTVYGLDSWTGILTGNAAAAHVSITGGAAAADERLRIQAALDLQEERLLLSLLDMKEGGAAGAEVAVTQNGAYILPGFAGSAVSSMEITVSSYAALWDMIRNSYGGRLTDVLDVRTA